eukprot:TRINITY_DN3277_c0_g1_i5.p1 TRINITY_DN3277_c0_g1~~TRINITY_DN3277_c0_g1_i5.p1  ORF type:complete len:534 (-),score=105.60 TRINITY_DN3277_c0_g1_i5:201-1802(-)
MRVVGSIEGCGVQNAKKQWVEDKKQHEYAVHEERILDWEEKEKVAAQMLEEEEQQDQPCSSNAASSTETKRRAQRSKQAIFQDPSLPPPRSSNVVKMTFTKTTRPTPARADNTDKLGPNDPERSKPMLKRITNPDAVDIGEQNPLWLKDRADKYVQVGDFQSAEAAYSAAISLDDDEYVDTIADRVAAYYSNRSLCYMQLGCHKKCESDCRRAMELLEEHHARHSHTLEPSQIGALQARMSRLYARRAAARAQLGNVQGSRSDFEDAIRRCAPEHEEALGIDMHKLGALELKLAADANFKAAEYQLALDKYAQAKLIDPTNSALCSNSALCWLSLGQMEQCIQECTECIQLLDQDSRVKPEQIGKILARRGSAYAELTQWQQAHHDFQRACSLLPANKQLKADRDRVGAALHRSAADTSFAQGDMELALAEYDNGLELEPEDPKMLVNRATCLLQLQQYEHCIETCVEGISKLETKPKMRASLLVRRGTALGKLGKYDAGLSDLKMAVQLNPGFAMSLQQDMEAMEKAATACQ